MSTVSLAASRGAARAGAWSLIAAAIGFMAVFSYLAARFSNNYVLPLWLTGFGVISLRTQWTRVRAPAIA